MQNMREIAPVISDYLAAYNAIDVDGMLACLADDVVFRNVSSGETSVDTRGKTQFAELARVGAAAFRTRQQSVRHHVAMADRAMLAVDFTAVVAADLPNGWKAGQQLVFEGASYFELRDGKIAVIVDES